MRNQLPHRAAWDVASVLQGEALRAEEGLRQPQLGAALHVAQQALLHAHLGKIYGGALSIALHNPKVGSHCFLGKEPQLSHKLPLALPFAKHL